MRYVLTALFLSVGVLGFSQEKLKPAVESFESEKSLAFYDASAGKLSISKDHFRYGKSSLEWQWNSAGSFGTSNFKILTEKESPLEYGDHFPNSPTLQLSVYNEIAQDGTVTISFEKGGKKEVSFDMPLTFTGWRRIWVPFFEMQGNAPQKEKQVDYDYFRVSTSLPTGKLFFDDIIFSQYQDDRHQYPDEIVPFIKAKQSKAEDHWMPTIANYDRIKSLNPKPVSVAVKMELGKLVQVIDQSLTVDPKYKLYINTLREDFQKLNIRDNGKTVVGPPLTFKEHQDYFDEKQQGARTNNDVQALGKVMKKIATFYGRANPAEQAEMKTMFLNGTKYFLDQGWQAGSNGGTRHHIGYNVREIAEAFFMMRHTLYESGLLKQVGGSLQWLFNVGMLLDDEKNFHINIDYLNTQSYYHLMLIFLLEEPEKQAAMLQAYSNYISLTLAQQKEEWGFKADGTAWHHNGHYPAYGLGAFQSVPKIIETLAGSRFRIKTEGHANFRKAFLATRLYSQLYNWGFGNAGRHPLEDNGIASLRKQYLQMANAGNPEGTEKIDKQVAAAYVRLWGKEDPINTTLFTHINNIPTDNLTGYHLFPYGATAVHRRNDWAAIVKGYSKYVWASEIYVASNRYGRYPANGSIQLMNAEGELGSGFKQEGWDWNRYPGTTVVHLPFKELEARMPLIMFRSNELFAGATELGGNGVFGMVLNEGKGSNADGPETKIGYPGKLQAKKSVFSFGDKLIAIGTNISSVDEKNPTQTNLFQSFLKDNKAGIETSDETAKKMPYKAELKANTAGKNWLIDPYGSGYHILSSNAVQVKKENQQSYHNKYSVNTGAMSDPEKGAKETQGDFASAWIDHGMAPKDASYQYVVYPFLTSDDQKNFAKKIAGDTSFDVLQADGSAHIVMDKTTNTMGYVVFEAGKKLEHGILVDVSDPALVMVRNDDKNSITISAVQPDLNFPQIREGKFENYSRPVTLTITLNGKWTPEKQEFITNTINSGNTTTITFQCVDGLPRVFKLSKI